MQQEITADKISVEKALQRGKQIILYLPVFMFTILLFLLFMFVIKLKMPGYFLLSGAALLLAFGFLYHYFAAQRWILWTFTKVENVHLLKRMAAVSGLIYAERKLINERFLISAKDLESWVFIKNRFDTEKYFQDDSSVPDETQIRLKKISLSNAPQIIISSKGLYTSLTGYYDWKEISDEHVAFCFTGKRTQLLLTYKHPKGVRILDTDKLNIKATDLEKLLYMYRERYKIQMKAAEHQ